jgi:hypothetical protein
MVLDEGVPEAVDAEAQVLIDFKGQFRDKLGAEHGSVLLVRPDGYIAFHRKGFDYRALSGALTPWVGRHLPMQTKPWRACRAPQRVWGDVGFPVVPATRTISTDRKVRRDRA